jgi:hypothetical protein
MYDSGHDDDVIRLRPDKSISLLRIGNLKRASIDSGHDGIRLRPDKNVTLDFK